MLRYFELVFRRESTVLLLVLQILLSVGSFVVYSSNSTWLNSRAIDQHKIPSDVNVPPRANYFFNDHGKYIFYVDSPNEDRSKFWLLTGFLLLTMVFNLVVISYVYYVNGYNPLEQQIESPKI